MTFVEAIIWDKVLLKQVLVPLEWVCIFLEYKQFLNVTLN